MDEWAGKTVAVVSPHLDDAVFSLGAGIAALTRAGGHARIITPFAGDPESTSSPRTWDKRCGFQTVGEAARARREEDRRACKILQADPVWLPFDKLATDSSVRPILLDALRDANLVLVPGFPCRHPDHVRASKIVLANPPQAALGVYVDQPYAMWRVFGARHEVGNRVSNLFGLLLGTGPVMAEQSPRLSPKLARLVSADVRWEAIETRRTDRTAKRAAIQAYRSQVKVFGRLMPVALELYEWRWGGEGVAHVSTIPQSHHF
jgi:LmbE family N-acetylglucosaminyl deacetylase